MWETLIYWPDKIPGWHPAIKSYLEHCDSNNNSSNCFIQQGKHIVKVSCDLHDVTLYATLHGAMLHATLHVATLYDMQPSWSRMRLNYIVLFILTLITWCLHSPFIPDSKEDLAIISYTFQAWNGMNCKFAHLSYILSSCFSLPYSMGTMEHLKSLVLDGNPLRSLRRDVVMVRFIDLI